MNNKTLFDAIEENQNNNNEKYCFDCDEAFMSALEDFQQAVLDDNSLENFVHYLFDNEFDLLKKVCIRC